MEEQQWVNDMVDDLQLMAAQEGDADSEEARWYVELRRLRRWLADDRLVDDYHPYFADGEDDDMREPEDTQVAEAVPEQEEETMVLERVANHTEKGIGGPRDGAAPEGSQEPDVHSLVQRSKPPWQQSDKS